LVALKNLPETNTLAYFCGSISDETKKIIILTTGVNVMKLFSIVADDEAK